MTVLFGHPTGNPNSHHAALAHFEAGRLEAFCLPWMPSETTLRALERLGGLLPMAQRLARRHFAALSGAPKVQGRMAELARLATRALGFGDEGLAYEANDWLMRVMTRECARPAVTAVHAYEDCSLLQFQEAKRLGKACIYDMPVGYYPAWQRTERELAHKYADWLPKGGLPSSRHIRPEQKRDEMALADLVLVPGSFVETTIRTFHPDKTIARAAYGVDSEFWQAPKRKRSGGPLRFIDAGQLSLRKGIPVLLAAWKKAALPEAELELVGSWQLAESKRPATSEIAVMRPLSREALRERYRAADVFVFPSFFEGMSLALLEAMACGLPVIVSEAIVDPELVTHACGRRVASGDVDALVEALRWFGRHRDDLPALSAAARAQALRFTWEDYRRGVSAAVSPFV